LSTSSQSTDPSGSQIQKFIFAKDEVAFNTNGNVTGVKYADINGSPFWKSEYNIATLYKNGTETATAPIRINLLTNEVYFLRGKEELVLDERAVNKIVFLQTGDTTTFISRVLNLLLNQKKVEDWVQVMNTGRYQLLKYIKKELRSADSGLIAKKYLFRETNYYFLKHLQRVERIQKLKEENVLSYLPGSKAFRGWIERKNIDFKKEKDIVEFLNHYNRTIEK